MLAPDQPQKTRSKTTQEDLEKKEREASIARGSLLTPEERVKSFSLVFRKAAVPGIDPNGDNMFGHFSTAAETVVNLWRVPTYHARGKDFNGRDLEHDLNEPKLSEVPRGYALYYLSKDKKTLFDYQYDSEGKFLKLQPFYNPDPTPNSLKGYKLAETHTGLWAEKRGDSFIKEGKSKLSKK